MSKAERTVNNKIMAALGILAEENDAMVVVMLKCKNTFFRKKFTFIDLFHNTNSHHY